MSILVVTRLYPLSYLSMIKDLLKWTSLLQKVKNFTTKEKLLKIEIIKNAWIKLKKPTNSLLRKFTASALLTLEGYDVQKKPMIIGL